MREWVPQMRRLAPVMLAVALGAAMLNMPAAAQQATQPAGPGSTSEPQQMQAQPTMQDVLRALDQMRVQLKSANEQIEELQREVVSLRNDESSREENTSSADALREAVEQIKETQDVTQSEVKTLQQTKVESSSKYPVVLTGMVLFNSYVDDGSVDNADLPLIALNRSPYYPHHSMGATLNQTQLGIDATGPSFFTARTAAQITADFFDGSSYTSASPTYGSYFHLRTAEIDLDWARTQVTAGLESPLISRLSPTSFATVAEPSLAWAGNLWTWLPQLTIEERIPAARGGRVVAAFGVLDPEFGDVTGEVSDGIQRANLQPGYESRVAWEWGSHEHPFEVGANGYYTRQLFYGNEKLDFWAGTADWRFSPVKPFEISGEFYRGRGLGDLGGGAFKNIVTGYEGDQGKALDGAGGWAQLQARLSATAELNTFFGIDSAYAAEVRPGTPIIATSPYLYLLRNQSFGTNFILRPRTYLIFSAEYRGLRSWYVYGPVQAAQNLTLSMGYVF